MHRIKTVSYIVHLGCYNRIPQTEWLINSKILFLTDVEAEEFEIMTPAYK